MLVAVNERIREVGLRKAVGAKNFNILSQFLLETMVVSLAGGILGVLIGSSIAVIIALGARLLGYNWALVISPGSLFLSTGFSIAIGLIFGLYPAFKAAKLNPISALRYE